MRRIMLALLLFALASGISACARPNPVASPESPVQIETMNADAKRSLIATNFPAEVPVPAGKVARGKAQGDDAWDYEIEVAASRGQVESWYTQAYVGRNWQPQDRTDNGSAITLTFMKAAAQSMVELSEKNGSTIAIVTLGVGAPVLQTQ